MQRLDQQRVVPLRLLLRFPNVGVLQWCVSDVMCVSCGVVYRAPTMVVSGMKPRGLCLFLLGNHEKFSRSSNTWYLVHPGFPAPSHRTSAEHTHVSHLSDELCCGWDVGGGGRPLILIEGVV